MRIHPLPVLAVAGLLAMTGCSPAHHGAGAAAPTAGPASTAAAGGSVRLTDYTDNDGPDSTVILTGGIGDYGTARSVHPDGSVDPEHGSQLALALSHGGFRLDIAALHRQFVAVLGALRPNTATCSGTATLNTDAPVVAGSGRGAYAGITGAFHLTVTLDEVYKPPACTEEGDGYLAQSIVMTGSGTVSLRGGA